MSMFARFDENPAMTLQDIKKKKTLRTHTHARTHGQRENSIPTTNKVCGGYKKELHHSVILSSLMWEGIIKAYEWQSLRLMWVRMVMHTISEQYLHTTLEQSRHRRLIVVNEGTKYTIWIYCDPFYEQVLLYISELTTSISCC